MMTKTLYPFPEEGLFDPELDPNEFAEIPTIERIETDFAEVLTTEGISEGTDAPSTAYLRAYQRTRRLLSGHRPSRNPRFLRLQSARS